MRLSALIAILAVAGLISTPSQAGDAGASTFMAKGCIGCHGAAGKKPIVPTYPIIGGKPEAFIAAELNKFRSGERNNPIMMPDGGKPERRRCRQSRGLSGDPVKTAAPLKR